MMSEQPKEGVLNYVTMIEWVAKQTNFNSERLDFISFEN